MKDQDFKELVNAEIVLSEGQVETIINGGVVKTKLPSGETVKIRHSFIKDAVAPMFNNRFKVADTHQEDRLLHPILRPGVKE
ncbi:hypothetical protein [Salinicoccus roseus]|uniref:Uncharacterized protein n=1 Tax=Salinicoccus roseus TaxID=45670 RepID=A0ABT4YK73_9STAP|nr:hypothetical protein [Salinicoccus roseus]MDB0581218.1 hypothetical protein [Salinicoccus roseus]